METPNRDVYGRPQSAVSTNTFMSKVYLWMTMGISLTGAVAMYVASDSELLQTIVSNSFIFYGLIIAELVLVIALSAAINKISSLQALLVFLIYSALNGVTLSIFSLVYTAQSIESAFYISAFAFAGLSGFGYVTKKDLGPVGNFCTMGLFGLVGMSLLSIFFPSIMGGISGQIYGLVGLIVFSGLTAYDTQKIKAMAPYEQDSENFKKGAIMGALTLYLDFINLFIFILRMSGKRK